MTGSARQVSRAEAAGLLSVAEDAGAADVQRAFLRAARHVHPDTLPEADEVERRAAAEAFDRLLRARDVLLVPVRADADAGGVPSRATDFSESRGDPDGPRYRRVPGRGLGGSLVVLALLAFLLVAIVTAQEGMRPGPFDQPLSPPPASQQGP